MEKEFVPYELALKLKKLGFDEECLAYYIAKTNKFSFFMNGRGDIIDITLKNSSMVNCTAPLWQQAFDWFVKVKGMYGRIDIQDIRENKWSYDILVITEGEYNNDIYCDVNFNSYEEARQACLEKLIEIVENNKQ